LLLTAVLLARRLRKKDRKGGVLPLAKPLRDLAACYTAGKKKQKKQYWV
jgi:hypothetical protein